MPALGYLIQWDRLVEKAKAGTLTMAKMHLMIGGFDQAELYKYEQERELSIALLEEWLVKYKFKNWRKTATHNKQVTPAMRKRRAKEVGKILNDSERWHSHGHGISMSVLRRDLKLVIDDFGEEPELRDRIKNYHSLLGDYMLKRNYQGLIHTIGVYLPFSWRE